MRVIVITNEVPDNLNDIINIKDTDYVIVVDGAFDSSYKQKIKMDLVIGDMDSVLNKKRLSQYEQIKLNPMKDDTDTKKALEKAYELSNDVILVGGIQGSRIEHFLGNIMHFKNHPNLIMLDNNSKIYLLQKSRHIIKKGKYINIFSYPKCNITLNGFVYNLNNYELELFDQLIISNEVKDAFGEIIINEGSALVIESNKD